MNEMSWKDLNDLTLSVVLPKIAIPIFFGFCLLAFLRFIFPNIINEYLVDKIYDLKYVTFFCIVSTLIIFKISKFSLIDFFIKYSIISFIYVFGVVTICIRIFFNI